MKNKKILNMGVIIATIAPLAMVVSCGSSKKNTKENILNENLKIVEDSLKVHTNLTFTGGTSITSNHLKILLGLDKKIDNSIKLSCVKTITKGKSISHTKIQLSIGLSHVQTTKTINVIWNKKVFIVSNFGFSQKIDNTHYLIGNVNGIYQVAMDKEGEIFSSILYTKRIDKKKIPSCKKGFSQKIDDTHYLIGTEAHGVYQVELNKDTKLIKKTTAISTTGLNSIPDVDGGFAQKIDDTHYLIGTTGRGVYQVELDKDTKLIKKTTAVSMSGGTKSIPSCNGGFAQKINDTHYLIGTTGRGVYQVELDKDTKLIKKTTAVSMSGETKSIPNVDGGFSTKIDENHYLIGTIVKGIYQVELDKDTKSIKKTTQVKMTGPNSIPDVYGGFAQKINDTHYLIGTEAHGIYQVELDKNTKLIKKTTPVKMTGPHSIPNVVSGFSQKIDDTHYLIGTIRNGVYQIVVGKYGMITKIEQYCVKPKL